MTSGDKSRWWLSLRQNGMLLSPAVLDEFLPDTFPALPDAQYEQLRDAAIAFSTWEQTARDDDSTGLYHWLDTVLEDWLGYDKERWKKHTGISDKFRISSSRRGGPALFPDRVLLGSGADGPPKFLVRIDRTSKRVGMGRGRQVYSSFLELLRGTGISLGILTNGHQFRLVYAGIDYDCWIEWESQRWFEEESGIDELLGFLIVCGSHGTGGGKDFPLLSAVAESRTRQGELSQVLGEQTRRAVEALLKAFNISLKQHPDLSVILEKNPVTNTEISEEEQNRALYQATIRLIMRLVVALFAEARGLLPKDSEVYYYSYSTEGLFAQLKQALVSEGNEALENQHQAWLRLLSLFRLIYEGSDIPDLAIPSYGGGLFRKGDANSPDTVIRALSLFEHEKTNISDLAVYEILTLLKIGTVRARSGRTTKTVSGAVDFSDLRTEFIGMMYEGLLDYQLRMVRDKEEAIIFLNLGIQPVLPFSLLKEMPGSQLKDLLLKLKKEKAEKKIEGAESEEGEEQDEQQERDVGAPDEAGEGNEDVISYSGEEEEESDQEFESDKIKEILTWARIAVEEAGLVRRPRGRNPDMDKYRKEVDQYAYSLVQPHTICYPGDLYLVRETGTRKGSGTFYTKPQLAVPTVHRTLEPLAYHVEGDGESRKLTPKLPEEILALKVCDPSMGSGSFLVAALRYLTNALFESLWFHNRIRPRNAESSVITLPAGVTSAGAAMEEVLPCDIDSERFEPLVKARLKRYIVERCIYGVDLNPVAVELGKLSLWVETMDRELPFEFLDHKLKHGNSLVGCWFDQFQEYPVMAWLREGGDKGHQGVHFEVDSWTDTIKSILNTRVKPEMKRIIEGQVTLDRSMSDETALRALFEKAVRRFESIHTMAITDYNGREAFFRDCFLNDEGLKQLKERFDLWCAIWFWPGDWLPDLAPTPELFYHPTPELFNRVKKLTDEIRFFHWELEFPDVFVAGKGGFDAMTGNPPWEISKPKSQEFFSRYDPIYRMRGKQEALTRQKEFFTGNQEIERAWLLYVAEFKSMGNWNRYVAFPFGDPAAEPNGGTSFSIIRGDANKELHDKWRNKRLSHSGFADKQHSFRYQGSADINTYKMFLEQAHVLSRMGGRFGFIVPSGVYTDRGSSQLRELFIERCKWEWIFGFENKRKIFQIHSSFKFGPLIIEKGGTTKSIHATFMHHDLADWETPFSFAISYDYDQVSRFSPKSKALLEIRTERDFEILQKIYANTVLLGDVSIEGWGIHYATEFHMTNDSHLFPPRTWWEERGYLPDQYGRWLPQDGRKPELVYRGTEIGPAGDIALPLYEGRMIGQFDFSEKGWVSGKGRSAVWREIPWKDKKLEPQFLLSNHVYQTWNSAKKGYKISFMAIGSATNLRSMITSLIPNMPCGNAVPILIPQKIEYPYNLIINANFNSLVYDYALRCRLGGINLNYFVIEETAILKPNLIKNNHSLLLVNVCLNASSHLFAPLWLSIKKNFKRNWRSLWAITLHERLRCRCIIDAIIAEYYQLSLDDFAWILRDCGHPIEEINDYLKDFDPKGFWRVDKDQDPELRHTVLALKAFADLHTMGLDAFCSLNNGEGWMIPEMLTYKINPDGTITFNTPDGVTVPVRERLGERFMDWQLVGTPEESWKECETHARNILGEDGFAQLMEEMSANDKYLHPEEVIGPTEKILRGSVQSGASSVAEVLKKAEDKMKERDRSEKTQRTLGDW